MICDLDTVTGIDIVGAAAPLHKKANQQILDKNYHSFYGAWL